VIECNQIFINGTRVDSTATDVIEVVNPATEAVIATVTRGTPEDVARAVYCRVGKVTYNPRGRDGRITHGGYSDTVVVDEEYVVRIPEVIAGNEVDKAFDRLAAGDVRYRFVIDIQTLAGEHPVLA